MAPSPAVLAAFEVTELPVRLSGGQGQAYRAGGLILKPGNDPAAVKWEAEVFQTVRQDGFRLAPLLRSSTGEWCVEGWCAWRFIEGEPELGKWAERVKVMRDYHRAVSVLPRPPHVEAATHPWAIADRVAWGEAKCDVDEPFREHICKLLAVLRPVELPSQVIHSDMAWENVLFHPSLPPAVIDISPSWRPSDFALAIAANDAIAWEGEDASILNLVDDAPYFYQLLTRATIFRQIVAGLAWRSGKQDAITDLEAHLPVVEICLKRSKK